MLKYRLFLQNFRRALMRIPHIFNSDREFCTILQISVILYKKFNVRPNLLNFHLHNPKISYNFAIADRIEAPA